MKENADVVVAAGWAPNAVVGLAPNNELVPDCVVAPNAGVVLPNPKKFQ